MGWSFGGGIAVRVGEFRYARHWLKSGERGFAAHIGFYSGCRGAQRLAGEETPVLVVVGKEDNYASTQNCKDLDDDPPYLTARTYPGAHHGFDRVNRCRTSRRGRTTCWHEESALKAREEVVRFLTKFLRPPAMGK